MIVWIWKGPIAGWSGTPALTIGVAYWLANRAKERGQVAQILPDGVWPKR